MTTQPLRTDDSSDLGDGISRIVTVSTIPCVLRFDFDAQAEAERRRNLIANGRRKQVRTDG